ncbi:YbaK/EbsC family protein [Bifidobacterium crudilactis]|uniref:YbaK/EbsC family protein n=1 Tax=Bifidobacterium crudilactis TaxID=327277 RepID=UPI00264A01F9|nr:YbaK/EbsC family protein [Bifidobacterium crudilactis]MDN6016893.1 YbaK/EbsC family protein [Bifidobacterium mongoliense]MDN6556942.1 YbaK/EbsC family protein [Acidipropionibacterium acidipropionici]MDN6658115.1 YbaK/EbsC family protein [Acidipropionibacterium jensenii]MDN5972974.1 YbaK/EbsC family protein [Bifidobacterium crudilactis]MDN6467081.1 YbaK/EbsC family protein [Bifidobacterium crudilactis]
MSIADVQSFLDARHTGLTVIDPKADTSTVEAAAAALGVAPAQIAKTLALRAGDHFLLLVTSGIVRLDNAKFRHRFGAKPRMLPAAEAEALTGQPVGGIGPFGHLSHIDIFCDESLHAFDIVYPGGGSPHSAMRVTPDQIADLTGASWVDVTRAPKADV